VTRKITISVPDDIAERLDAERNVSAFVSEAVRRRIDAELTHQTLMRLGFDLSAEGMAEARRRIDEARAMITPELSAKMAAILADARRGPHGTSA
jgi:post-segregation antitoxin (ccd killing protein)